MASSPPEIPTTMKRLVVTDPGTDIASCKIEIQADVPVPTPVSGEVLIKVIAAAVNPSDYSSWFRSNPENCPIKIGKEGCGIVVALGGGLSSYATGVKVGSRVGFVGLKHQQGAYSEYVVANVVGGAYSMPEDLPIEDAASFFVNPYTAIGIIDTAKRLGAKAFIHTAAASQLGQMIVKLAPSEGVEVINVVRRDEQATSLKEIGAKHVIVTGKGSTDDEVAVWKEELRLTTERLEATVAFDAIAGRSTGDMMDVIPKNGTVFVYGGLAGRAGGINPIDMIYNGKKLEGFFLSSWIGEGGVIRMAPRMLSAGGKVTAGLKKGGWSSSQFSDTTLENVKEDLMKLLDGESTGKKLRIRIGTL